MKTTITTEKIPVKLWLDDIEEGALQQAKNLANLPFAFKHIAIMPDSHQGYGMPIGGVLATKDVVIPNAVGVDIGCGMCAVKTPWQVEDIFPAKIKSIMGEIRKQIPVGFSHHPCEQDPKYMPSIPDFHFNENSIVIREYTKALSQIGTLGGGNHFIEIQKDIENNVWIMLHSGSRNIGKQVADHYNKLAVSLNKQWHAGIPTAWELAFLPLDTEYAQDYMRDMQYCVQFAEANRALIMSRIADIFNSEIRWKKIDLFLMINIAHNYAAWEHHFGHNVLIHRKGATLARTDTMGIIPGSQGSKSYIVKGKGNLDSFNSCSHGAGRKMGRNEAKKILNLQDEINKMNALGIIHGMRNQSDLDEAAGAYKDIDVVMENQRDLVDIVWELTPLAVIKGN